MTSPTPITPEDIEKLRGLCEQVLRWQSRIEAGTHLPFAHPETADLARGTAALLSEVERLRGLLATACDRIELLAHDNGLLDGERDETAMRLRREGGLL